MEGFIREAFTIICDHYGVSRYHDGYPELVIVDDDTDLMSGEFRDDCCEIMINLHSISHLDEKSKREEIVRILTHEFIHYHQCPRWMTRYSNSMPYWDNPYEREAYAREDELIRTILKV